MGLDILIVHYHSLKNTTTKKNQSTIKLKYSIWHINEKNFKIKIGNFVSKNKNINISAYIWLCLIWLEISQLIFSLVVLHHMVP